MSDSLGGNLGQLMGAQAKAHCYRTSVARATAGMQHVTSGTDDEMRKQFLAVLKQPITYSFAAPFACATSISGVLSTCHILKECTSRDLLDSRPSS